MLKSALAGVSDLISRLHVRTLTVNTQWGELTKSETGEKMKDNFVGDFKDFCEFLSSKPIINDFFAYDAHTLCRQNEMSNSRFLLSLVTKIDLENIMSFQVDWDLYHKYLMQPENIVENSHNLDVIIATEANVQMWMKTMERVRLLLTIPHLDISENLWNFMIMPFF